jgi:hypothetical protein
MQNLTSFALYLNIRKQKAGMHLAKDVAVDYIKMPNMGYTAKRKSQNVTIKTQTFAQKAYRVFISLKYEVILFLFQIIKYFMKSDNNL